MTRIFHIALLGVLGLLCLGAPWTGALSVAWPGALTAAWPGGLSAGWTSGWPAALPAANRHVSPACDLSMRCPQAKPSQELSEPPQFPNYPRLTDYFYDFMVYPADMLEQGRSGYAICRFTVDTFGRAQDPVALESSEPACAQEVIRLIRTLPRGLPARDTADRRVESLYTVHVKFTPQRYHARLQAQEAWEKKKGQIFAPTESVPVFPGGDAACFQFLNDHLRYPPSYRGSGRKVRVICQFILNSYGEVTRVTVVRSSGLPPFDAEAVRVVSLLPRWKPAFVYAPHPHYIDCLYTLPVTFVDPGPPHP